MTDRYTHARSLVKDHCKRLPSRHQIELAELLAGERDVISFYFCRTTLVRLVRLMGA